MEFDSEINRAWTTLKSEYLFRRPWLTVRRDEVGLPDGRVNPEFYVLEYPDWVNVIAITEDGRFVMERQYRYGLGEVGYEICAGVIEEGEDPLAAAKRELSEETGYEGGTWEKVSVLSANPSTTNNLTHCYLARGVRKVTSQHLDPTEDIEVILLSRSEMMELLASGRMRQALMVAPLWQLVAQGKI